MKRVASPFAFYAIALFTTISCKAGARSSTSLVTDSVTLDSVARAKQDSINRTLPGYVVDSILPVEEELRRFRAAIAKDSVSALDGGAPTRDSLVRKLVHSLEVSDTAALQAMLLNAREFAWLVYPESPYTKPPYTQAPALVWNQIANSSASGLTRLVRRLAGEKLRFRGYTCSGKVDRQGSNKFWTSCIVSIGEPHETVRARRLFGSIIERDGQFKFVSFANEF
ncbi:MAG: hypothetical protein ABIQ55_09050 [Gemmatimonadaceae bacterium]